jgi:hypothetical protein
MADKANQHFVPQFYFRYFSENKKSICVLNRKNGKPINNASIKEQASKKHFYGAKEIENDLSKIEGEFSYILNKVKTSRSFKSLTSMDYQILIQNIALQKSRTMSARKKSKKIQDHMHRLLMEVEINRNNVLTEDEKEKERQSIKDSESDPKEYQLLEMSIAIETALSLLDLHPLLLINKTTRPFIFGDSPAIYTNPQLVNVKLRGVLGSETPGLLVYFPIDSNTSILLVDHHSYKIKGGQKESLFVRNLSDVAKLNKLQLHNASNAVYFSNIQYSQYVVGLWKQEKRRLSNHNIGEINESPDPDYESEDGSTSEILHFYEPQLPLVPKLSFLKYEEISEENYRFNQR